MSAAAMVVALAVLFAGAAGRRTPVRRIDGSAHRTSTWRPRQVIVLGLATALAAVAAGLTSLVVLAAIIAAPVALLRQRRRRRRARLGSEGALPDAVDALITCLRAGQTPALAVVELSRAGPLPLRSAFTAVDSRLHRGDGFADAITELATHAGPAAVPFVTVLAGGARDGLPLVPMLDRLADEAAARRRRLAEAAARRLPVRLAFPLVCCTLPSFVLLAIVPAALGALNDLRLPT